MKRITGIITAGIAVAILTSSCNNASKKNMGDASQHLKEAGADMKEAVMATNDSAKTAAIASWNSFKNDADTSIAGMEKETAALNQKIAKAGNKEKEQLKTDLSKANEKLRALKERLQQKNLEFDNDIKSFNAEVAVKNQSFQQEFKHDMGELGTAFKDLFKKNVK